MTSLRHRMEQELVTLTRSLAVRDPLPLVVGDDGDRAVLNEAHERLGVARDRVLARIRALKAALVRMDAGTWAKCELCGELIAARRLDVMPETPWCVACAASLERDAAGQRGRDTSVTNIEEDA